MKRKVCWPAIVLSIAIILSVVSKATAVDQFKSSRVASTGAMNHSFAASDESWIQEVRIHLGTVGGSGTLNIKVNRVEGPSFDVVFLSQDMTAVVNLVWQPDSPIVLHAGDSLDVSWANAGGVGYGLEIVYTKGWTP